MQDKVRFGSWTIGGILSCLETRQHIETIQLSILLMFCILAYPQYRGRPNKSGRGIHFPDLNCEHRKFEEWNDYFKKDERGRSHRKVVSALDSIQDLDKVIKILIANVVFQMWFSILTCFLSLFFINVYYILLNYNFYRLLHSRWIPCTRSMEALSQHPLCSSSKLANLQRTRS